MCALEVMYSYVGESPIAPSYVRKLTMKEYELQKRISKLHEIPLAPQIATVHEV